MTQGSNWLHFFYDGQGQPAEMNFNGTVYIYVKNLQGDIVGIVDTTGRIVVEYKYDAWGRPIYSNSLVDSNSTLTARYALMLILNPFRYRGYAYDDEVNLFYSFNRYYIPEICRWINCDIVISGPTDFVLGSNCFAYCFNNPINMVDFTGDWPKWVEIVSKVVVAVAVVVTATLVLTGSGGVAATIALGASLSALNGGCFNEKVEGSFTSGAIGGAVSGTTQGLMGLAWGPVGTFGGGVLGTGLGTFVAEGLDSIAVNPKKNGSPKKLIGSAINSAIASIGPNLVTTFYSYAFDFKNAETARELMYAYDEPFNNLLNAGLSAIDDAATYIIILDH